jgi:hypothetical protein
MNCKVVNIIERKIIFNILIDQFKEKVMCTVMVSYFCSIPPLLPYSTLFNSRFYILYDCIKQIKY